LVAEAFISAMKDNLGYWYYTSIMFDYIIKVLFIIIHYLDMYKIGFSKSFR